MSHVIEGAVLPQARVDRTDHPGAPGVLAGRRERIMQLLRSSPEPRSVASLAAQLRVHPNTVRFHLDALRRAGQVDEVLGHAAGPGRPPVAFRPSHRMDPAGPTSYRLLAGMLTHHLATRSPDPMAEAADLGRQWAAHLVATRTTGRRGRAATVAALTDTLTDLGFAPEPPDGPRDGTIRLRHCPFLGLVAGDGPTASTVAGVPAIDDGDRTVRGNRAGTHDGRAGTGGDRVGTGGDRVGIGGDRVGGGALGGSATGVRGDGRLICAMHLGLMQGTLTALRGPVTVDRLDPFVEPDLCVAHLTSTPSRDNRVEPRG